MRTCPAPASTPPCMPFWFTLCVLRQFYRLGPSDAAEVLHRYGLVKHQVLFKQATSQNDASMMYN